MQAIIQTGYGSTDVLELQEIDKPAVGDGEVLVRVHAASLHPDVWHVMRGLPYALRLMGSGLVRPKHRVPGTDIAGKVEVVGKDVRLFEAGDEVFGEIARGHQWKNGGAFAEYAAVPEEKLALKPAGLSFEEAAAVPTSGLIALQAVRYQGHVEPGHKVLVNGAGGGVGTFAVQLARAHGAAVTAVDGLHKMDLLRSIGAAHVIDYTADDFTRRGERYDAIVDIPGNRSVADYRRALTPNGTYVLIGHDGFGATGNRWIGSIGSFLKLVAVTPFVSQRMAPRVSKEDEDPLTVLKEFIEAGQLTPIIDRTYPLRQVPEAMQYMEKGEAVGRIVIAV
jgi:NADPH:quinone reductase-like Zn-dependent oxidoreductase